MMPQNKSNRPFGVTFMGVLSIGLSLMAVANVLKNVFFQIQNENPSFFFRALEVPYGIIVGAFSKLPVVGQVILPVVIAGIAFSLIRGANWARMTLLIFSFFNFLMFVFEFGSVVRIVGLGNFALEPRSLTIVLALWFYASFIIFFMRSSVKNYFKGKG